MVFFPGFVLGIVSVATRITVSWNDIMSRIVLSVSVCCVTSLSRRLLNGFRSTLVFHLCCLCSGFIVRHVVCNVTRTGRWSEPPMSSPTVQETLFSQLEGARKRSGALPFPVPRLWRVGQPVFAQNMSLSDNYSSILVPRLSSGCDSSHRGE